jgi:hypothetical protein
MWGIGDIQQESDPKLPDRKTLRGAFGINVHLKRFDAGSLERTSQLISQLGAGRVRLVLDWYKPDELALLEPLVRQLRQADVEILGSFENLVPGTLRSLFLRPGGQYRQPLDELDAFLSWIETAVNRLTPYVSAWEVLNETNTARFWLRRPAADEYMRLLEPTANLIRSLAPDAKIMLGSIAGNDVSYLAPIIQRHYLRALTSMGALDLVDLVGFHPYTPACYAPISGELATMRGVCRSADRFFDTYPKLRGRAWITELGISRISVRLNSQQIGRVYGKWIRNFAAQGVPTYLWCLSDFDDPCYGRFNPERTFGLADTELRLNATGHSLIEALATAAPGD